jgi:hypothetical protein
MIHMLNIVPGRVETLCGIPDSVGDTGLEEEVTCPECLKKLKEIDDGKERSPMEKIDFSSKVRNSLWPTHSMPMAGKSTWQLTTSPILLMRLLP